MANAADINALMRENLKDAGLEGDRIEMCMDLILKGEYDKLNKMLSEYRENLLKNIHVYTAKLDCLDYFTYTITKNGGTMK
ncbi:MAG: hypothetical protein IJS61_09730 [Firmicutes bacterium]|nr:hypothetical protein [Bacillota bacterium]